MALVVEVSAEEEEPSIHRDTADPGDGQRAQAANGLVTAAFFAEACRAHGLRGEVAEPVNYERAFELDEERAALLHAAVGAEGGCEGFDPVVRPSWYRYRWECAGCAGGGGGIARAGRRLRRVDAGLLVSAQDVSLGFLVEVSEGCARGGEGKAHGGRCRRISGAVVTVNEKQISTRACWRIGDYFRSLLRYRMKSDVTVEFGS